MSPSTVVMMKEWKRTLQFYEMIVSLYSGIWCHHMYLLLNNSKGHVHFRGSTNGDKESQIYIRFYHRCAPYAVGFLLGYLMYRTDCKVKIHKVHYLSSLFFILHVCVICNGEWAFTVSWRFLLFISLFLAEVSSFHDYIFIFW